MPVPRKRKRHGKMVRRQPVTFAGPDLSDQWTMRIKPSQMIHLRDDPDFLMIVKMGRIINAVLYAQTTIIQFGLEDRYLNRRQYRRGLFVLAGYLHEAINILRHVEDRHVTMESFIPLRKIVHGVEYKQTREYLREIRNVAGFHLADSVDIENTKLALSELELTSHVLMGADDKENLTYYFELSDMLDIAIIGRKFKADRDIDEVHEEIHQAVLNTSHEFATAAVAFQVSLARKMDLAEYIYGNRGIQGTSSRE